jgi:hypothetical protein
MDDPVRVLLETAMNKVRLPPSIHDEHRRRSWLDREEGSRGYLGLVKLVV